MWITITPNTDNLDVVLTINIIAVNPHCMESVRTGSFSVPYFPGFVLSTEIYEVNVGIQSKCGKTWTRKTTNKDTFYAVHFRKKATS